MSKGEIDLGQVLAAEFPHYKIIPQYAIKIKNHTLFIDYYIPQLRLAIEYDGRQHQEFVQHYHHDQIGFKDSQYRDSLKNTWCTENNVWLIRVSHREEISLEIIRSKLKSLGQKEAPRHDD